MKTSQKMLILFYLMVGMHLKQWIVSATCIIGEKVGANSDFSQSGQYKEILCMSSNVANQPLKTTQKEDPSGVDKSYFSETFGEPTGSFVRRIFKSSFTNDPDNVEEANNQAGQDEELTSVLNKKSQKQAMTFGQNENKFMRFGRPEAVHKFMRLGRGEIGHKYMRFGRNSKRNDKFMQLADTLINEKQLMPEDSLHKTHSELRNNEIINKIINSGMYDDDDSRMTMFKRMEYDAKNSNRWKEHNFMRFGRIPEHTFMRFGRK